MSLFLGAWRRVLTDAVVREIIVGADDRFRQACLKSL